MAIVPASSLSHREADQQHKDESLSGCCDFLPAIFGGSNSDDKSFNNFLRTKTVATPNIDETELARELNELSFNEREQVFEEIHGVTELPKETPDFVQTCVVELDEEVSKLSRRRRAAIEKAIFLKPSIDRDIKFKLMFLRADYYDATKAARRIAKYFEDKLELFGDQKLVKNITLDDLTKDDMEVFEQGGFLVLPHKDRSGRPICYADVSKFDFNRGYSLMRCSWYMIMNILEDEATQLKGASNVTQCLHCNNLGVSPSKFYEVMIRCGDTLSNLPLRNTSYHFCYDNVAMEYIILAFRSFLGKFLRLRSRVHFGSGIEIQYKLMTYGIICPFLAAEDSTELQLENHRDHIADRRILEANENERYKKEAEAYGVFPYPSPNDVLVGRGCPYQTFPGNQLLSDLLDKKYLTRYSQTTNRFEKTCIHMDVIKTFQDSCGGRFLERTDEGWKVVEEIVARKKVSSAFRSKMAKFHNNNNTNNNTTNSGGVSTTTTTGGGGATGTTSDATAMVLA